MPPFLLAWLTLAPAAYWLSSLWIFFNLHMTQERGTFCWESVNFYFLLKIKEILLLIVKAMRQEDLASRLKVFTVCSLNSPNLVTVLLSDISLLQQVLSFFFYDFHHSWRS